MKALELTLKAIAWPFVIATCLLALVVYSPFILVVFALEGPTDDDQLMLP